MSTYATMPEEIVKGLNKDWTVTLDDYKASDGWTLSYYIANASGTHTITSTADGDDHAVTLTATETDAFTAGDYHYQAIVAKGTDKYLVGTGSVKVKALLDAASDARSHVRKVLDALESMLEGKASKDQQRYIIGSTRLDRMTPEELLLWRDKYKAELTRLNMAENVKKGLGGKHKIHVRFS